LDHSLIVTLNNKTVFTSDQHWLHPLFEFEEYLQESRESAEKMFLRDKVAGKAAACMMVYLGIRKCHIELLSERAIPIFEENKIEFSYDHLVARIECGTEDLITDDMSIKETYLFLRKRAGRVKGVNVKMKDVSIKIEGQLIIDQLNLDLGQGDQLIIHGANGAGKTTLLRSLLGLMPLSSGTIEIGGFLVGSSSWSKNRNIAGYVHQETIRSNFPISAGEVVQVGLGNKRIPAAETRYRVEVAMRRTGSFHLVDQPYLSLSGGEKQRVSLARCLCQDAGVFLLDEPTSFLDPKGKEDLLDLLNELSENEAPTMIVVSHELQWVERLNWDIKELKGGKLC
jgi:zinc transport system ATP-binding protein